ncbi:MAG: LysM peptidoglycan-binding domain-containing protein [Chloroflexi bacterium]|nr:LysM peptidoglycan-binding domain-containing protein [Chloroflexota bacterium]
MQKSQPIILVTIVIMAVITAVGMFLAWSYLQRRPEYPDTVTTTADGVEVTVNMNANQRVRLVNPMPPDAVAADATTEPAADQTTQEPPPPTPEPTPVPTATPVPKPVIFEEYVVQPNDSLYGIAQRIDTSIALMAHHDIAQDNLVPGQAIQLPKGNPAYCPGRRPYAVGEGDTAYSISRRFDITAETLREINKLDENFTVRVAEIICVP